METISGTTQWNVYDDECPTRLALDRIADKWTALIVGRLAEGPRRFGQLRRDVSGISAKVLTQQLRGMERDGLLRRRVYASVPPRVEYRLTPLGQTLIGPLEAIRGWAECHVAQMLVAKQAYDERIAEDEFEEAV